MVKKECVLFFVQIYDNLPGLLQDKDTERLIVCTATLFVYLAAVAEAVAVESTFFDDLFVIFQLEFTQVVVTVDFVHLEDFPL